MGTAILGAVDSRVRVENALPLSVLSGCRGLIPKLVTCVPKLLVDVKAVPEVILSYKILMGSVN